MFVSRVVVLVRIVHIIYPAKFGCAVRERRDEPLSRWGSLPFSKFDSRLRRSYLSGSSHQFPQFPPQEDLSRSEGFDFVRQFSPAGSSRGGPYVNSLSWGTLPSSAVCLPINFGHKSNLGLGRVPTCGPFYGADPEKFARRRTPAEGAPGIHVECSTVEKA